MVILLNSVNSYPLLFGSLATIRNLAPSNFFQLISSCFCINKKAKSPYSQSKREVIIQEVAEKKTNQNCMFFIVIQNHCLFHLYIKFKGWLCLLGRYCQKSEARRLEQNIPLVRQLQESCFALLRQIFNDLWTSLGLTCRILKSFSFF